MRINVNVEYVLRQQKRVEVERAKITRRIAAWVQRCVDLETFSAALTSEERSDVSAQRARRSARSGRSRRSELVLALVKNDQTNGGDDATTTTATRRAL